MSFTELMHLVRGLPCAYRAGLCRQPTGIAEELTAAVQKPHLSRHMAGQMIRIIIHQLEEALNACRGVVRALALVPMRQHEHNARALAPPLLRCTARTKELVQWQDVKLFCHGFQACQWHRAAQQLMCPLNRTWAHPQRRTGQ